MGEANKLLAPLDGVPMLAHVVEQAVASKAKPILVVTGHQDNEIRAALAGRPVTFIHNPDFAEGLATSIKAGIDAVPPNADGRSEEHTSELQSLMRNSYAVFCLK